MKKQYADTIQVEDPKAIEIAMLKYEISIVRSNIDGYKSAIMECKDAIRILQQKIEDIKNS